LVVAAPVVSFLAESVDVAGAGAGVVAGSGVEAEAVSGDVVF